MEVKRTALVYPNSPAPGYRRFICERGRRVLVCSTCEVCGFEIVDSVSEKLVEREEAHREECRLLPTKQAESGS
jgi:hypothetical protein